MRLRVSANLTYVEEDARRADERIRAALLDVRAPAAALTALTALAYAAGLFSLWLVFGAFEGEGGPPRVWVPYLAGYGLFFGLATGCRWVVPFPFLHLSVIDPLVTRIQYSGYPAEAIMYINGHRFLPSGGHRTSLPADMFLRAGGRRFSPLCCARVR